MSDFSSFLIIRVEDCSRISNEEPSVYRINRPEAIFISMRNLSFILEIGWEFMIENEYWESNGAEKNTSLIIHEKMVERRA